jgi:hypothetical protein
MQDTKLHCPSCGYNLTALTTTQCPECGKHFALSNPIGSSRPQWLKWLLFAGAIIMSIGSFATQSYGLNAMAGNSAGGAACGLWIAFAILHVWGRPKA